MANKSAPVTRKEIIAAIHSSIEGVAFLVADSLEFELDRQLTDAEQLEISGVVSRAVMECEGRELTLPEALSWEEKGYQTEVFKACVAAGIKVREAD